MRIGRLPGQRGARLGGQPSQAGVVSRAAVAREKRIQVIHPAPHRPARQLQRVEESGYRNLGVAIALTVAALRGRTAAMTVALHGPPLYHRCVSDPAPGEGRDRRGYDVACVIVGAGPAGLATAACLRGAGLPFVLIDRAGVAGGAYRDIHDGVTLASPAALDGLPGLALAAAAPYVTVPEYRAYLGRYGEHHRLEVTRGQVEEVRRAGDDGFVIHLGSGGRELRARFVVVATGMWTWPVRPALPGHELCPIPVLHAKAWRGAGAAGGTGTRLLIIGGAASAVELAEEAARAAMHVTVAVRGKLRLAPETVLGLDVHHYIGPLERLPPWLARRYCAQLPPLPGTDRGFSRLRAEGRIAVRPGIAHLDRAAGSDADKAGRVTFTDGTAAVFDRIVTATGYRFEAPFLPPEVERAAAGHVVARHNESRSWPGLFVVGAPCANRLDSEFLRGIARDAALVARAIAARL